MNFYLFPKLVNVGAASITLFKLPTIDGIYGIMLLPIMFQLCSISHLIAVI